MRPKFDLDLPTPADNVLDMHLARLDRAFIIYRIQRDLYGAAIQLGQTGEQAEAKIDDLFVAFAGDWSLYELTGSPAIVTAIQNDATLPWLDTDVAGLTIRQRLINRLS